MKLELKCFLINTLINWLIDWLISSMMRVIQVPVGVSQNISIESHFASAAACSSALGEFIVLRVEHWMTDSCPSWQQKTQKFFITNMTLTSVLIWTLLCFTQGENIMFLSCENHLECIWVSPQHLMSSVSSLSSGSAGQNVVLTQPAAKSLQLGQTVSIDCKASRQVTQYSGAQYYLAWYHQKPGEAPKALIYQTTARFSGISSRFSGSGAGNGVDFTLTISGVQAEDSGVYYCQSYHWINSHCSHSEKESYKNLPELKRNWSDSIAALTLNTGSSSENKLYYCVKKLCFNICSES